MKQLYITILLTMLMSMVGAKAFAHDFAMSNVDGVTIYYEKTSDTEVAVSFEGDSSSQYSNEYSGNVIIPNSVTFGGKNYTVTSIGGDAFSRCSSLTSITIPNSVTSIGSSAFSTCGSLTSITIPNSVTSIGSFAFYNCGNLTSITIPNSVTSIGSYAFSGTAWYNNQADGLVYAGKIVYVYKGTMPINTSITIKEGTLGFAGSAFRGRSDLTSITIPNSVTSIGDEAFRSCTGLTSITIPNSVTSIGYEAFSSCTGLTSITIPNSVTKIDNFAFRECSGLTSLTILNGIKATGVYAFADCSSLTSITIPSSVTRIDDGSFCNCSELTSITIPNSVTSIGSSAFHNCGSLTSITIPNSVISIGDQAFRSCTGLTSITIPNNMTSIGALAFYDCRGLTPSITIPSSVTSIGEKAFYGCTGLTQVTFHCKIIGSGFSELTSINEVLIGNEVTKIGDGAFTGCRGLTSVIIPNSVTCVGNRAFSGCDGLTSITIPESVTSIGNNAFQSCSNLTSITIPSSVTSIGSCAFRYCTGLTSITIPNSVTKISEQVFYGCSGLTSVTIPNSVTSFAYQPFYRCSSLTSVIIDINTPLSISDETFYNQSNATLYVPYGCKDAYKAAYYWKQFKEIVEMAPPSPAIEFADANVKAICVANWDTNGDGELSEAEAAAVTSLGSVFCYNRTIRTFDELRYFTSLTNLDRAFSYCTGLTLVTIPNSVTSIGNEAFGSCNLTSITIPNSVTIIGNKAFSSCNLTSITIPNSVTIIGDEAFAYCDNLTSITIGNRVTSIGDKAFYGCIGLTSITIPNSVTTIGGDAFRHCTNLASITIGNGLTSIGDCAFSWCDDGINSIVVSSDNKTFDSRDGCNAIISSDTNTLLVGCKNTIIPNSVTSIGYCAFLGCYGLTSITIPNSVTSIGDWAFCGCWDLASVSIPYSVTTIGDHAFYGYNKLTSITIPNRVTSIGNNAFGLCDLTSVTVNIPIPLFIDSSTFYNRESATLYVPKGSKADYENAAYWKEFKEIVELPKMYLNMNEQAICKDGMVCLSVSMENDEEITAFQFNVEVPEGISVTGVQLGNRKSDSHTVEYQRQADGSYLVTGISSLSEPFSGNEGELVSLTLSSDKDIEKGDYCIGINNIVLTSLTKGKLYPADVSRVLTVLDIQQGDADTNGKVNVADIVAMVNYIQDNPPSDFLFLAADMNADDKVDVFDVLIAINSVLDRDNSGWNMEEAVGEGGALESMYMSAGDDGIRLNIANAARFTAFQFDVEVPEGAVLIDATLAGSDHKHLIRTNNIGDNRYRVIAVSLDNTPFRSSTQGLLWLMLSDNSSSVVIDNIMFVTPQGESVYFSITEDDFTTGIREVDTRHDEVIYDLSGCRVNTSRANLPKGIYIINNKKVVIK